MALTFRAASSTGTTNAGAGGTLTITKPTGTIDGDFMLLQISQSSTTSMTPPAGWTLITSSTLTGEGAGGNTCSVYWKSAASEGADYTITVTAFTFASLGIITWYSSTGDDIVVDASAASLNTPATPSHVAPSVTTSTSNTELHCFYSVSQTPVGTPHSGMTERWDEAGAGAVYLMTETVTTAGETSARTMTGDSQTSAAITVAITEVRFRVWPSAQGYFSIIYNGVDITRFCTQGELAATYSAIETTKINDPQAQELPLRRAWTMGISGNLDKALDDTVGIDGVTRPSPYRDLIITIAEGYSLLTHTWTGTATEGGFIENYTVSPADPNSIIAWSADLGISGPPVVTEGA